MHAANPNEVYTGGLMQHIGSIIIYWYFHDESEKMNTLADSNELGRVEAEAEVLSVHHGFIAAMVLRIWNIPETVSEGVVYHHNREDAEDNREHATVINIGNTFAKQIDLRDNFLSFDDFFKI